MTHESETDLFYEDETYRVTVMPGESRTAIIAFGGIGLALNGIQIEEFRNSLRTEHTVFFVIDKARSWWNDGDALAMIDDIVTVAREDLDVDDIAVIGNSMGGSGALLAAHHCAAITRCLALVPQADVRLSLAEESRWLPLRERIAVHRFETFALPPRAAKAHVVFGEHADQCQRQQFLRRGIALDIIEGYDHDLASRAKREAPDFYRSMIAFVTDGTKIAFPQAPSS